MGTVRTDEFRKDAVRIADEARASGAGPLSHDFGAPYDLGDVAFSHGNGVVRGVFLGRVDERGAIDLPRDFSSTVDQSPAQRRDRQ